MGHLHHTSCSPTTFLIFSRATSSELQHINGILSKFCSWSGQQVNSSKSGIFFSKNLGAMRRQQIKQLLGMKKLKLEARYLGNPLFLNDRKKKEAFQFLLDKIKNRLASWKSKTLSWAGRSTLIKSVISSIPIYSMSLFRLPVSVLNKIDQVAKRFWWGNTDNKSNYYTPKTGSAFANQSQWGASDSYEQSTQ